MLLCPNNNSLSSFLLILPDLVEVIVSHFCVSLLCLYMSFVLLPFCLTDSVFSKFVHLGGCVRCGMLVQVFVIMVSSSI